MQCGRLASNASSCKTYYLFRPVKGSHWSRCGRSKHDHSPLRIDHCIKSSLSLPGSMSSIIASCCCLAVQGAILIILRFESTTASNHPFHSLWLFRGRSWSFSVSNLPLYQTIPFTPFGCSGGHYAGLLGVNVIGTAVAWVRSVWHMK
jgi:hypothetical protein